MASGSVRVRRVANCRPTVCLEDVKQAALGSESRAGQHEESAP
jgi:hypothetical protein